MNISKICNELYCKQKNYKYKPYYDYHEWVCNKMNGKYINGKCINCLIDDGFNKALVYVEDFNKEIDNDEILKILTLMIDMNIKTGFIITPFLNDHLYGLIETINKITSYEIRFLSHEDIKDGFKLTKVCTVCGKLTTEINRGKNIFCSTECRKTHQELSLANFWKDKDELHYADLKCINHKYFNKGGNKVNACQITGETDCLNMHHYFEEDSGIAKIVVIKENIHRTFHELFGNKNTSEKDWECFKSCLMVMLE